MGQRAADSPARVNGRSYAGRRCHRGSRSRMCGTRGFVLVEEASPFSLRGVFAILGSGLPPQLLHM